MVHFMYILIICLTGWHFYGQGFNKCKNIVITKLEQHMAKEIAVRRRYEVSDNS